MKTSLTDFRPRLRDKILDLLWRQWTAIGVSGHGEYWEGVPIDPEALLLGTCTMARHDARLFDAMLEWMSINGRYVNVQRLKRILRDEPFSGEHVLRAVAAAVTTSTSIAKWAGSARLPEDLGALQPLFFLKDGRPMPMVSEVDPVFAKHGLHRDRYEPRGVASTFPSEPTANLIVKLRALVGVSARCEILAYLLLNGGGSPRQMAREIYYYPATISNAMDQMRDSGYIISHMEGRKRHHRLVPETWRELLLSHASPAWIVWPRLLSAIEKVWTFLCNEHLQEKDPLAQASSLRRLLLQSVVMRIDTCGLDFVFGDLSAHPGEKLIPFFVDRMATLLDAVVHVGQAGAA